MPNRLESHLTPQSVKLVNPDLDARYRHTKIIFTVGPSTMEESVLRQMIMHRVDVCRINMAHADPEWTRMIIRRIRKVCDEVERHIAIMMDIKGPEVRTGDLEQPLHLETGSLFDFTMSAKESENRFDDIPGVNVNYPGLIDDVSVGDTVLVDSGLIRMEVIEKLQARIRCRVIVPGKMGNRRHINLPGVRVKLPALTEKDKTDMLVGIDEGVDFFALSFVRTAEDLDILRSYLKQHHSPARVIAKIEDQQAINNLEEIVEASDGLMVARGDLGIECPYEELPIIQHVAVKTCLSKGKPVIVATHMLESMIEAPVPTRAEVTDISNAVFEKADCIMLSGETTTGKYPIECVQVLKRIARRIESLNTDDPNKAVQLTTPKAKLLRSAVYLANDLERSGIIVFSESGLFAQIISTLRPRVPVYAFTQNSVLFRHLLLLRGIEPFLMDFSEDPEETIIHAISYLKRRDWVVEGDNLVVITNALARENIIDTLQLRFA